MIKPWIDIVHAVYIEVWFFSFLINLCALRPCFAIDWCLVYEKNLWFFLDFLAIASLWVVVCLASFDSSSASGCLRVRFGRPRFDETAAWYTRKIYDILWISWQLPSLWAVPVYVSFCFWLSPCALSWPFGPCFAMQNKIHWISHQDSNQIRVNQSKTNWPV